MDTKDTQKYLNFIKSLENMNLAIVYSSRFEGDHRSIWYHRWRSDIIGLYAAAAENLGMEPTFYNVDQFLDVARLNRSIWPNYILNLNAGNKFLGNLSLVPSLAQWLDIPIAFCNARTAIVSEDKKLSKDLARSIGFRVPRNWSELSADKDVILKPCNLGSSRGVSKHKNTLKPPKNNYVCEEFIRGVDGTIVVILDKYGESLFVPGAQLIVPDVVKIKDWIYTEQAKQDKLGESGINFLRVRVNDRLADLVLSLAESCGSKSVARIDIRYTGDLAKDIVLTENNSVFIEYNAMPTLGMHNSVNKFIELYIEAEFENEVASYFASLSSEKSIQSAMYLLASGLYVS